MDWKTLTPESEDPVEVSSSDFDNESTLETLHEGVVLNLVESEWPVLYVSRDGDDVVVEVEEHIYTKYWWHKYHASVFCEAMLRAVRRLRAEGAPLSDERLDDDDEVHLFVRWKLRLPDECPSREVINKAKDVFDAVWARANQILDDSDSVLVLGKDTGEGLQTLKRIATILGEAGLHVYIIKEEADRVGESVMQKVLRYALSSRYVIVENSDASGHLYEFPHVAKMAECTVAVLQRRGQGATWMFEDGYFRHNHWQKFEYDDNDFDEVVQRATTWAQGFLKRFGDHQKATLPWFVQHTEK